MKPVVAMIIAAMTLLMWGDGGNDVMTAVLVVVYCGGGSADGDGGFAESGKWLWLW